MKKFSALIICAVFLFAATSAYADPVGSYNGYLALYLDDGLGHTSFIVSDNGKATFDGVLGNWDINVTTLITYPYLGTQDAPRIDLNTVNISSSSGGTLQIWASVCGFTPTENGSYHVGVGGTTNGSVQFAAYYDDLPGQLFFTGYGPLFLSDVITGSPFAVTFDGAVPDGAVDFTLFAQITQQGNGGSSFDMEFKVPEPASLLLLGLGLLGIAGIRRKH